MLFLLALRKVMPGFLRRPGIDHVIPVVDPEVVHFAFGLVKWVAGWAFVYNFLLVSHEYMSTRSQELNYQKRMLYEKDPQRDLTRLDICYTPELYAMHPTGCDRFRERIRRDIYELDRILG